MLFSTPVTSCLSLTEKLVGFVVHRNRCIGSTDTLGSRAMRTHV